MMSFPPKLLVLRNVIGHLQVLEILEISCNFIDVSGKFLYVMPNFDLRVCISNTVHHLLSWLGHLGGTVMSVDWSSSSSTHL